MVCSVHGVRIHYDQLPRREKDHPAQLRALRSLFQAHPEYRQGSSAVTMVLLGSARNPDDKARVKSLQDLAVDLGVHVRPSLTRSSII
jgi:hypothetical protein